MVPGFFGLQDHRMHSALVELRSQSRVVRLGFLTGYCPMSSDARSALSDEIQRLIKVYSQIKRASVRRELLHTMEALAARPITDSIAWHGPARLPILLA